MRGMSRSCVFTWRRRRHRPCRQTELLQHRLELRAIGVRHDERSGAELVAADLEVVLGRQHLHVRVLEAERDEIVVRRVLDDQHAAGAFDAARRLGIRRQHRHRLFEQRSCRRPAAILMSRM